MARNKKISFRGASFRHLDMRTGDNKAFIRAHVVADITKELADKFGWQIYQDGHLISGLIGSTKLEGALFLGELSFQVNGTKSDPLECRATTAEDFQLTRKKSETGDGVETQLRFILTTADWEPMTHFFGNLGDADGVLKLELAQEKEDAQPTLADQPHLQTEEESDEGSGDAADEPEPDEPKGKSSGGALASRLRMEKIQ